MSSRYSLSSILALLLLPNAAIAQAAPDPENVVVTASRIPLSANAVGSVVTVVDGEVLQQRQITTAFDALREVPGVAVSRSGALGSLSQIRIRGGESNHTLVLIDDVIANDPAASSEFNFGHLMAAGIERIEILRGPQSALWGADAVSGVVNVIATAPRAGLFARGTMEGGSFGTFNGTALVNAGNERAAAIIDGSFTDTAGSNIARSGDEKDGYTNITLGARGVLQVSPVFALSGSLRHVDADSEFDFGFPYPVDSPDHAKAMQTYGRMQGKLMLLEGALEAVAGASLTDTRTRNYSGIVFSDGIDGSKHRFDVLVNSTLTRTALGVKLSQRLSIAAETSHESFNQTLVNFAAANQERSRRASGVGGEYWVGFDERAFVSLGVRHDWNSRFADTTTWRTTMSAALPQSPFRLHASAGTGVKNPDFYELFGFVPSSFVGNPLLKQERSLGFDWGLEAALIGGRVLIDATYFHADLKDEIFTDFTAFPYTARNAGSDSSREGVELLARVGLTDDLALSAAYTYTEARENNAAELRRPNHVGSINLDYRFADGAAFIGLGADFHGSQRDTDFATFNQVVLPGYTLLRLSGSYEIVPNIALTARVENLLDEKYEEVVGYRTRGLGVFAGLRVNVGP